MAAVFVLLMMACLGVGPEDSAPGVVVTPHASGALLPQLMKRS